MLPRRRKPAKKHSVSMYYYYIEVLLEREDRGKNKTTGDYKLEPKPFAFPSLK